MKKNYCKVNCIVNYMSYYPEPDNQIILDLSNYGTKKN